MKQIQKRVRSKVTEQNGAVAAKGSTAVLPY